MDVAEELFATSGVEGVSVRSINAAAGLAPASVHYHFGDKDGLLRAVIARRGEAVTRRQVELLVPLEGRRRRPTAEEAVRLLADPFAELLAREPDGGRRWLAIVAALVAADDPRLYQVGFGEGSVQERINATAARAYPNLAPEVVAERWRVATTALLQLIAGAANAAAPDPAPAEQIDLIVGFVATGLDGVCRGR
jgi:AcrR family transcriptional regulator